MKIIDGGNYDNEYLVIFSNGMLRRCGDIYFNTFRGWVIGGYECHLNNLQRWRMP
jgi:hypothetical protein